ncbi:SdiA-regulated domain-containing protein [Lutibacter sp. A80]|uniref:SdiA-regulated domain-containing protein n=1 Tax=Lutibacter sp. A80 TaxID=2918453 RepID=UPI001F050838|nr:SdiA-regulated domain-containing protein [Lutibacter sp. A80]UMB59870.1 SdiA-regulated domain-containing protein [Lutibacter sp. A80]
MMRLSKILCFTMAFMALLLACNKSDSNVEEINNDLELISSTKINVSEASGLAINTSGTTLYTVSDNTNNIYQLSTDGTVLKEYPYNGEDIEGISVVSASKVVLVEERAKQIVEYDLILKNYKKNNVIYGNNESNSGLEGIAYNLNDNTFFAINEKNPGILMRLRTDFSIIESYNLDFASDYSGIFHDKELNILWILSDESKTINKCSLKGVLIKSYKIDVIKAEGIAVTNSNIYVVSDSNSTLYNFKKPIE